MERREVAPPPRRTPGRRRALWAILAAAVIIIAAAIAALALNNQDWLNGGGSEGEITETPLAVNSPVAMNQSAANVSLSAAYPGQGQLGSYTFVRGESSAFQVVSTPVNGYQGPVLTKVFVQREPGGINQEGIEHNFGNNNSVHWTFNYINGTHYGASDIGPVWQSDGSSTHRDDVNLIFNRTGTYNVTFQSFNPETGKALSQPLSISPINVPENGTLTVKTIGNGTREGAYYAVQTNITNDWNLRRDVNASGLVVYSKTAAAVPDPEMTSFKSQSLDIGQSTQFTAYYKIADDPTLMEYRDQKSGQVIQVPFNATAAK
ncbi:hypothetical protein [Methanomassiliicoccus luminyensis]|uniref:hypothetical protein n=1 Tax=Methanomassiliicoccus luminyensis TaxID=1080712 RepID=UPI0011CB9A5A|nr:hypothetical protein [Methanomassiliicoccus luminyensis]